MKKSLIFLFFLSFTFVSFDVSWAKEYISEKIVGTSGSGQKIYAEPGAFSINVPDGWAIKKDETFRGKVWFYLPNSSQDQRVVPHAIWVYPLMRLDAERGVRFGVETPAGVKEEDLLDHFFKEAITFLESGSNELIKIISKKKMVLDGVAAYRIDYILDFRSRGGSLWYESEIGCFTREYTYSIVINSPDSNGILAQEKMLDSIKLKH